MICRETHPNMIYTRHILELSEDEQSRLKEILEELRVIFNASSVGFAMPDPSVSNKTDYVIQINGADTIGHIF